VVQKLLKMIVCMVFILPLCGCNAMVLSQHLKMYAKAVEYRYISQEIVQRIKSSVTDRIVLDRAKTFYAALVSDSSIFMDTMELEAKTNSLDDGIGDKFTALAQAFNDLKEFIPDTVSNLGPNAVVSSSMTACEFGAQAKGKAAADEIKMAIGDKTRSRGERVSAIVVLLDQNRWLQWGKI